MDNSQLWLSAIYQFLLQGGWVLWGVFALCVALWLTLFERWYFFQFQYPQLAKSWVKQWQLRRDKSSWLAIAQRKSVLAEADLRLQNRLPLTQTLIQLCPLVGLLGTVTGMVSVFDLLAVTGSSDARQMASGIYAATLPTMSGLLVGLSGFYFSNRLQQWAKAYRHKLAEQLAITAGLEESVCP